MSEAALLEEARADLEHAAGKKPAAGVPFSGMTTIGCGGPAGLVIEADSTDGLAATLETATAHGLPWLVTGLGSNMLVADAGWPGLVIRLTGSLKSCRTRGNLLDAGGGASLPKAASVAAAAGLSGLEPLAGIPGTAGGAVAMNAGAFGASIGDFVSEVEICRAGKSFMSSPGPLDFGYRSATLPLDSVVSRVILALSRSSRNAVSARMRDFRGRREASQPVGKKTCGSVFKNPPGAKSAGMLLDQAGCKGMSRGAAQVSESHANFIVNNGGAAAADVMELINKCRRRVYDRFGISLELEVRLLGGLRPEPLP